ncbi:MAG: DUF433 domain-containing protein, partial [archaeon]
MNGEVISNCSTDVYRTLVYSYDQAEEMRNVYAKRRTVCESSVDSPDERFYIALTNFRAQMGTIVETADTLGGEPRIEGTRIGVLDIAELVLDGGYTPADT